MDLRQLHVLRPMWQPRGRFFLQSGFEILLSLLSRCVLLACHRYLLPGVAWSTKNHSTQQLTPGQRQKKKYPELQHIMKSIDEHNERMSHAGLGLHDLQSTHSRITGGHSLRLPSGSSRELFMQIFCVQERIQRLNVTLSARQVIADRAT